jgi:hypothetical protein
MEARSIVGCLRMAGMRMEDGVVDGRLSNASLKFWAKRHGALTIRKYRMASDMDFNTTPLTPTIRILSRILA